MKSPSRRIEKQVLSLLAREWQRSGPPGILDIKHISARLEVSTADVYACIKPLYADGTVDVDQSGFAAFLTPEGYDRACGAGIATVPD